MATFCKVPAIGGEFAPLYLENSKLYKKVAWVSPCQRP